MPTKVGLMIYAWTPYPGEENWVKHVIMRQFTMIVTVQVALCHLFNDYFRIFNLRSTVHFFGDYSLIHSEYHLRPNSLQTLFSFPHTFINFICCSIIFSLDHRLLAHSSSCSLLVHTVFIWVHILLKWPPLSIGGDVRINGCSIQNYTFHLLLEMYVLEWL